MVDKLVIWGASGHALVIADIIRLRGDYELIGFIDDINPNRKGAIFSGVPILGGREQLNRLFKMGIDKIILGFGDCTARLILSDLVHKEGFKLVTAIHPSAVIAQGVMIGSGTVVAAGTVINSGSVIGNNVIINTSSSVDHECIIADGAHIAPGVHLAGCVTVGQAAWIGIGATVIDHISIGARALIGAGSVVIDDIPNDAVAYGVPARQREKK